MLIINILTLEVFTKAIHKFIWTWFIISHQNHSGKSLIKSSIPCYFEKQWTFNLGLVPGQNLIEVTCVLIQDTSDPSQSPFASQYNPLKVSWKTPKSYLTLDLKGSVRIGKNSRRKELVCSLGYLLLPLWSARITEWARPHWWEPPLCQAQWHSFSDEGKSVKRASQKELCTCKTTTLDLSLFLLENSFPDIMSLYFSFNVVYEQVCN